MRVLVCGGRDFKSWNWLKCELDTIHNQRGPILSVIHGNAVGADGMADCWADGHGIPRTAFPADWNAHGKAAGPMRNQKMLDEGKPELVVAFPGGRGTADMVRRAKAAGVEVIEVGR